MVEAMKPHKKLIETIKPHIKSALLPLHIHFGKPTDKESLAALLRRLHPVDCGIDLIRVGGAGDGGYLIPDDLSGIEFCFSPGVSTSSQFESELADRHIRSYLADYSVDGPPLNRPEFTFDKKFLGAFDRYEYFTLQSWKNKYLKDYMGDLILQMDIEGSEYEVILSTPQSLLDQFRIMVIEFHKLQRLFDSFAFSSMSMCFEKLLDSFHIVHIHPNNYSGVITNGDIAIPPAMEFTFISKRRVSGTQPRTNFPHILDRDNTSLKHIALPRCWYSSDAA